MQANTTPEVCLAMRPERLLPAAPTEEEWAANAAIARSEAARQYILLRNRRVYDIASLDELRQQANMAMVRAVRQGYTGPSLRIAIRHSLLDSCRYSERRRRHYAPMPKGELFNRDWDKDNSDLLHSIRGDPAHVISGAIAQAGLSERQKEAIHLIYFGGMTERDAARTMGCTHPMVHKHLVRAIHRLRKIFSLEWLAKTSSVANYRLEGQNEQP